MAKEHKYAKSRIEIETNLSATQVISFANQIVGARKHLRILQDGGNELALAVTNVFGAKFITFTLSAHDRAGGTFAISEILEYQVSQQSLLYFIPLGPKVMEGYREYKNFMTGLQQLVLATDPSARIQITEIGVAA